MLKLRTMILIAIAIVAVPIASSLDVVKGKHLQATEERFDKIKYDFPGATPNSLELERIFNHINGSTVSFHQDYCNILLNDAPFGRSLWSDIAESDKTLTVPGVARNLSFEFPFFEKKVNGFIVNADGHIVLCTRDCVTEEPFKQKISLLGTDLSRNPSLSNNIKLHQNDERMIVQWENMTLKNRPDLGNFSFQLSMFKDGTIVFLYKNSPFNLSDLEGISIGITAMPFENFTATGSFEAVFRIINKSHLPVGAITNWTTIIYTPDIKCGTMKNCRDCTNLNSNFRSPQCFWCTETDKCIGHYCGRFSSTPNESACDLANISQCYSDTNNNAAPVLCTVPLTTQSPVEANATRIFVNKICSTNKLLFFLVILSIVMASILIGVFVALLLKLMK